MNSQWISAALDVQMIIVCECGKYYSSNYKLIVMWVHQPTVCFVWWVKPLICHSSSVSICPSSVPTYCRNAASLLAKQKLTGTTRPGMLAEPHPRCLVRLSMMWACRWGALNSRLLFTLQEKRSGVWSKRRAWGRGLGGRERKPAAWLALVIVMHTA